MPPPSRTPQRLPSQTYSVRQTASLLGVSPQLVTYRQVAEGRLAALRLGSRIVIRKETIVALLGRPIDETTANVA